MIHNRNFPTPHAHYYPYACIATFTLEEIAKMMKIKILTIYKSRKDSMKMQLYLSINTHNRQLCTSHTTWFSCSVSMDLSLSIHYCYPIKCYAIVQNRTCRTHVHYTSHIHCNFHNLEEIAKMMKIKVLTIYKSRKDSIKMQLYLSIYIK